MALAVRDVLRAIVLRSEPICFLSISFRYQSDQESEDLEESLCVKVERFLCRVSDGP